MKRAYSLEVNGSTRVTRASFRRRRVTVKFTFDSRKLGQSLRDVGKALDALNKAAGSSADSMKRLWLAVGAMDWPKFYGISGYRDPRHARAVARLQLVYWPDAVELHWY